MKTYFKTMLVFTGFFIAGCNYNEEKTADKLLENPEMREAIYSQIANDSAYLTNFITKLMKDENGISLMKHNYFFVKTMCTSENMDSLLIKDQEVMGIMTDKMIRSMEKDSIVCDKTCYRMMESDQLKKFFKKHSSTQWEEGKSKK